MWNIFSCASWLVKSLHWIYFIFFCVGKCRTRIDLKTLSTKLSSISSEKKEKSVNVCRFYDLMALATEHCWVKRASRKLLQIISKLSRNYVFMGLEHFSTRNLSVVFVKYFFYLFVERSHANHVELLISIWHVYREKEKKISKWILTFSCHTEMWQVAQNKKNLRFLQKNQSFTPIKQLYMLSDIWRLNDCLLSDMKNYLNKKKMREKIASSVAWKNRSFVRC